MASFGRFTQALGGVVETLSYASPTLTLTQSVGTSPLTTTISGGGGITGTGTAGYIARFSGSTIIGNSLIFSEGVNVGIGTITPDRLLTVNGVIKLSGDLISTIGGTTFRIGYEAYSSTGGVNMFTEGAVPLVLGTTSAERMRITSGGNVLIGTTTDAGYKLDVNGTARISGALLISNNDITQDGTRPIVTLKQSGTSKLLLGIASTADDIIVGDAIGDVDFRTNSQAFNFSINNGGGIAFKLASNAQATFSSSVYLGASTIEATAKFQVDSTTQGVLVPRMNEDDINAIASPADGLLVYNLDQQVHCFWDSAGWHKYTHTNM